MAIMTHAEFHLNRLILILILGIRASEPPPPPPVRPGERLKKAGPDGVKAGVKLTNIVGPTMWAEKS